MNEWSGDGMCAVKCKCIYCAFQCMVSAAEAKTRCSCIVCEWSVSNKWLNWSKLDRIEFHGKSVGQLIAAQLQLYQRTIIPIRNFSTFSWRTHRLDFFQVWGKHADTFIRVYVRTRLWVVEVNSIMWRCRCGQFDSFETQISYQQFSCQFLRNHAPKFNVLLYIRPPRPTSRCRRLCGVLLLCKCSAGLYRFHSKN